MSRKSKPNLKHVLTSCLNNRGDQHGQTRYIAFTYIIYLISSSIFRKFYLNKCRNKVDAAEEWIADAVEECEWEGTEDEFFRLRSARDALETQSCRGGKNHLLAVYCNVN